ncbi:MAG: GTPase [Gammaproteobacteria bacterium]
MLPVIALVGRPNVGKSTLFNRLTQTRDALVADFPGLTRDRQYGLGKLGPEPYLVVDTGGLTDTAEKLADQVTQQALAAVNEADAILLLVDARGGLTSADEAIAAQLRRTGKPLYLTLNKAEDLRSELVGADFYSLGIGQPYPISAAHNQGVQALIGQILSELPGRETGTPDLPQDGSIKLAVVGRPNVGKSTLINRLLGEERC